MSTIRSIGCQSVLNSHVEFTNEFIVELDDGTIGTGASPKGETISIYEDKTVSVDPMAIIRALEEDGLLPRPLDQEELDRYLERQIPRFGRNNAYGLSLAFFNAASARRPLWDRFGFGGPPAKLAPPQLCCNILNGGWHAYTNPILSDFPEFILVSRNNDIAQAIAQHNEIQRAVKQSLSKRSNTVVGGNTVYCFSTADNRACIEFLLEIRDTLGLAGEFDLMIDASAGDLWTGEGYCLGVTGGGLLPGEEFCEYWLDIIRQYDLRFLEDPFHERDVQNWHRLTTSQSSCSVIGDNLYSSDVSRIKHGAAERRSHGVVIKPNQAGTVSAARRAVETAQGLGQTVISSHRSISTESTFLATLTCLYGVRYVKIGPLMTDYSSIVRLNEIIRLTENTRAA